MGHNSQKNYRYYIMNKLKFSNNNDGEKTINKRQAKKKFDMI